MRSFRPSRAVRAALVAVLGALAACGPYRAGAEPGGRDPLAGELARWTAFVEADTARDDHSTQIRDLTRPALAQSRAALARGRRGYALLRLAAARSLLVALRHSREHASAGRSAEAFEAEWTRSRAPLLADSAASRTQLAGLRPAALRAMAEAAYLQARVLHDASLDYGRATLADAGLHYMGQAAAQKEFLALARTLHDGAAGPAPAFRSLAPELDSLQADLLAVYRPPVSLDRHAEFIGASAALKEARELDEAGFARGALLRYLQAVQRLQPLRGAPVALEAGLARDRLAGWQARLEEPGRDHSLGRVFLEAAWADLDDTSATATHATAAAIVEQVLPRYFSALEPVTPRPRVPTPAVTVTLVRWPYT